MVIRHSTKELLAKSMVTRPMKCIVVTCFLLFFGVLFDLFQLFLVFFFHLLCLPPWAPPSVTGEVAILFSLSASGLTMQARWGPGGLGICAEQHSF